MCQHRPSMFLLALLKLNYFPHCVCVRLCVFVGMPAEQSSSSHFWQWAEAAHRAKTSHFRSVRQKKWRRRCHPGQKFLRRLKWPSSTKSVTRRSPVTAWFWNTGTGEQHCSVCFTKCSFFSPLAFLFTFFKDLISLFCLYFFSSSHLLFYLSFISFFPIRLLWTSLHILFFFTCAHLFLFLSTSFRPTCVSVTLINGRASSCY